MSATTDLAETTASKVAAGARRTPTAARAAALTAAGVAGGLVIGSRLPPRRHGLLPGRRRRVLGVPIGREAPSVTAAKALADGARRLVSATQPLSNAVDDVQELRKQLEQANKRSPVEVLLDGLTHRRGAHKEEN